MEAVYRVEVDGFTTAPGLNETIVGMEKLLALLGQLDKQKDVLNKATTTKAAAGAVAEIEETAGAIKKTRIEEEVLAEATAKRKKAEIDASQAEKKANADAQKDTEKRIAAQERAEERAQKAAERTVAAKARANAKAAKEAEKLNRQIQLEAGLLGGIQAQMKRLEASKPFAKTEAEVAKINKQLEGLKTRYNQINNTGKQATNTFGNALGSFQFKFNFLGNLFASVTTGLADSLVSFGSDSVKAFIEAEKNAKQLQFALKGNSVAAAELIQQSADLQDQGIFSDDDIQKAQTQLANFGANATQIKELTPLITDLAAATGKDLGEATDIVIKGINGQTKGLKVLGIDYKDTGNKAQNLAILTEKLTKFQGANAAQLDTTEGEMRRVENALDDFKELVGEYLVNEASGFLDSFDMLIGKTSAFEAGYRKLSTALTDSAKKQNDAFIETVKEGTAQEKLSAGLGRRMKLNAELSAQLTQFNAKSKTWTAEQVIGADLLIKQTQQRISLVSEFIKVQEDALKPNTNLGDDPAEQEKKNKEAADLAKQRAAAQADLRKLEAEAMKDAMKRDLALQQLQTEAELKGYEEKHKEGLLSVSEFEKAKTLVLIKSDTERSAIRKKYADEEAKGYEELFAIADAEYQRLQKLQEDFAASQHELTLDTIDANIALKEDGADKEVAEIEAQSQRKIEALETERDKQIQLATEAGEDELQVKKEYDDLILLAEAKTEQQAAAIREKYAKEEADKQREQFEQRISEIQSFVGSVSDAYEAAQEKRIDQLGQQETDQRDVIAEQRARAIAGQSNSLAAEEAQAAKIEAAQAEQQRRLERIKKLEAFFNLFAEFAKQDPDTALTKALTQVGTAEALSLLFAEKGGMVGDVKDRTQLTASGFTKSHGSGNDVMVVASPNEGILTESEVKTLGGRAGFYDLKRMLAAGDNPIDAGAFGRQSESFAAAYLRPVVPVNQSQQVVEKIDELISVTKNPPIDTALIDSMGNLLHYVKKNNQTTITRKSNIRKGWLD